MFVILQDLVFRHVLGYLKHHHTWRKLRTTPNIHSYDPWQNILTCSICCAGQLCSHIAALSAQCNIVKTISRWQSVRAYWKAEKRCLTGQLLSSHECRIKAESPHNHDLTQNLHQSYFVSFSSESSKRHICLLRRCLFVPLSQKGPCTSNFAEFISCDATLNVLLILALGFPGSERKPILSITSNLKAGQGVLW